MLQFFTVKINQAKLAAEIISTSDSELTATTISTLEIESIIDKLKQQQHRNTMRRNYYCVWKLFNQFIVKLDVKPRNWEERVTLFVGYLAHLKRKSTTIKSYVSAIKAVLTSHSIKLNEDRFLLCALTRACKIQNDRIRTKIPIRRKLLNLLMKTVDKMFGTQPYLATLYKAMFATAYYGMLRICEYAQTDARHAVKACDVLIGVNKKKIMLVLFTSKTHGFETKPQIIKIDAIEDALHPAVRQTFCPFQLLSEYFAIRKQYASPDEQFFVFRDRSPVMAAHFRAVLHKALEKNNINPMNYSAQGMRTGRATDLLEMGVSVETIRKLGRWKSSAIFTYLRY